MFGNSITVYAYESEDNFYPFNVVLDLTVYNSENKSMFYKHLVSDSENKYLLENGILADVNYMTFYGSEEAFTFPYNGELYDYYLLGDLVAPCSVDSQSTFKPQEVSVGYYDVTTASHKSYPVSDLVVYDIDNRYYKGFGFYEKIDFSSVDNIGFNWFVLAEDKDGLGNKPANLIFEMGILAVDKTSSQEAALAQILSQLQSMESSINSSIGSAADQIAGAVEDQYTMSESEDFGVGQIADQVEEKLGVLTFGADTLHNFLDLFSADTVGGTKLTFPAFRIDVEGVSYNVWPDITFDLSFLEENFGVLITAVRTVTVLCVWLAVLGYLVKAKDHFINNKG